MREIVGNSEELFLGKREHGAQFLGTWELSKVNFWEHLNLFLRNKGKTVYFYREQKNMPPPPPGGPLHTPGCNKRTTQFLKD